MLKTQKISSKKVELVSIIDVVFLLLIFFLVTINIMRRAGGSESFDVVEETKVPDTASNEYIETDMVIVIYPWAADGISNIEYYLFTPTTNWNNWNALINAGAALSPAVLHSPALNIYVPPAQLEGCLSQRGRIVIKAVGAVPWEQVVKIWDLCRQSSLSARISLMIGDRNSVFRNIRGLITQPIVEEIVG